MGASNIPQATPNTTIPADDHNALRSALIGDYVPRNSSANAEDVAGSLGQSAFRWLQGYIRTLFIGQVADNISIEADSGDCIIKVGGVERARIPQSVGMQPAGMVSAYSGTTDPDGWIICDGREVDRTTFARLFAAIGTSYGDGNSSTTFDVPDFRGRFLRGADDAGTAEGASGLDPDAGARTAMTGGGNAGNNIGSVQDQSIGAHFHLASPVVGVTDSTYKRGTSHGVTNPDGFDVEQAGQQSSTSDNVNASETRPKNAYVNYIIKT